MVWGHFPNRQAGVLASSNVQCTITFGSHLFLARCQWSASNKNFTWTPLKRTLHNEDFSRVDVVLEDNTDMCSLSGDGSVVVIGIDAIWRGNVGAVFVLRVQASSGSVPPTSVVSLFFCHFFPSPFFSAIPILLDTTTVPLIPAPCFRS